KYPDLVFVSPRPIVAVQIEVLPSLNWTLNAVPDTSPQYDQSMPAVNYFEAKYPSPGHPSRLPLHVISSSPHVRPGACSLLTNQNHKGCRSVDEETVLNFLPLRDPGLTAGYETVINTVAIVIFVPEYFSPYQVTTGIMNETHRVTM